MISDEQLEEYSRFKNHKHSTRQLCRGALRHWRRLGCGAPTSETMASYRDTRNGEGAAAATVRGELSKLVPLAKYLGYSPVVRLPLSPARCPNSWSKRELKRLLHEAHHTKRTIWTLPGSLYWPALLHLAVDTGERIGALLSLRQGDVDEASRRICFAAEVRKGGYRDAVFEIRHHTLRCLRMLPRNEVSGMVFLRGNVSTIWKAYGRLLSDAGLPNDRRSKFHRLRRTAATTAYLRGEDATALLGHSSDAVTRKSYIDWVAVRQSKRHWWQRVWG